MKADAEPKKKFKSYPIGYFHIDIVEVRTKEGKLHMFVAIDRTSKFAFVKLEEKANRVTASALKGILNHILTDLGIQFVNMTLSKTVVCS